MCSRDANKQLAWMLISSEIDARPIIPTFSENKGGNRAFLWCSGFHVCIWVAWARQGGVLGSVTGCQTGISLHWDLGSHPDASSSWLCDLGRTPTHPEPWSAYVNGKNSPLSQHHLITTNVPDTDCLLYRGMMKGRRPCIQGPHCHMEGLLLSPTSEQACQVKRWFQHIFTVCMGGKRKTTPKSEG